MPPLMIPDDPVTILMGVLDGAEHLTAQLDSLVAQTHSNWTLRCSDDGSSDSSVAILQGFRHQSDIRISTGPRRGFAANYLHLLRSLPAAPGYVCLADQDDIWMPDKMARALASLARVTDEPALYCARRWDWTPGRQTLRATSAPRSALGFTNALVENVAFGNTIMLNPAAAQLARAAAQRTQNIFAHDWWLYLLMTGCGAQILFDRGDPCLFYRQHTGNALGDGRGIRSSMGRKAAVWRGTFSARLSANVAALQGVGDMLTPAARQTLYRFEAARRAPLHRRLTSLQRVGVYRQGRAAHISLFGAAGLGCV